MASQVVGVEANVADDHFRLVRVDCRVSLGVLVTLQHVQHSSFPRVVQPQENDLCTFLEKAEPLEARLEVVPNEHL